MTIASRMLATIRRRFGRDTVLRDRYTEFMQEYVALGHMAHAPPSPTIADAPLCYLPHHGVTKMTESGPKIRVVFNGSVRTTSGASLNAAFLTGPNLVPSLPDIVLRWRCHKYAFATDIEKMYRQIEVHPDDRDAQRILWEHEGKVVPFQLNTVTYGTACAPYLAVRVLQQLARDEGDRFPAGAAALLRDAYVDDILSGAASLQEGQRLQQELTALCMAGGFPLKKWAANDERLLAHVPCIERQDASLLAEIPTAEHSVLGLCWRPADDCLSVVVNTALEPTTTKRTVLSQIARLFDPLGWLAPVIVQAKLIIQNAWLQQRDWDDPLEAEEATTWHRIVEEIPILKGLCIPRWFSGFDEGAIIQIHGFADASERAFAAVVYLRTAVGNQVNISLIQAKTKVAPLKRISLPRLELCAASLLAKLSSHVRRTLGLSAVPTYHWSDSTVALAWIRGHPARWTTFVANRVTAIQQDGDIVRWRHVPGKLNPADCASRGMSPQELSQHTLWWKGPSFLYDDASLWPTDGHTLPDVDIPEQRASCCLAATSTGEEPHELTKISDLRRLLRVTAWLLRWRRRACTKTLRSPEGPASLDASELDNALLKWVRTCQQIAFPRECADLLAGRAVQSCSALRTLKPIMGQDGVLRVDGRLEHSLLHPDQRNPIILPASSHLSRLLVEAHHRRTMHGGTQVTLASIRQRFWLLRGRQLVKKTILRCPTCIRWRAATPQPRMAVLPAARVTPSRPFLHTGVDYAGPIWLRTTKGRGHNAHKAFFIVFVCFSTRAVHLEVASDYSTDAFLAAFRRFTARRGLCTALYSDRGSNFVGADGQLRELFRQAAPEARRIADRLADEGVRWVFNPPAAPNFGGLWKAAVKSMKYHLRRVVGEARLTFGEITTFLAEVGACLNCRPHYK